MYVLLDYCASHIKIYQNDSCNFVFFKRITDGLKNKQTKNVFVYVIDTNKDFAKHF